MKYKPVIKIGRKMSFFALLMSSIRSGIPPKRIRQIEKAANSVASEATRAAIDAMLFGQSSLDIPRTKD